jgi:endoglucanase
MNMHKKVFSTLVISILFQILFAQKPTTPFPSHFPVTKGCIKPTNQTQKEMDDAVSTFYTSWKNTYLKQGCTKGEFYIEYINDENICVSEGQGYGMVIVAYMAGFDAKAKEYFDGLYQWAKSHPSTINSMLMNWRQAKNCVSNGTSAATDGDLDIAYALLLAHHQWGSKGKINYLSEAINLIGAIKASETNAKAYTLLLGDWANSPESIDDTRPSDFMFDHFVSFNAYTNDSTWNTINSNCFKLIGTMQSNFSPVTGLIPDFIEDVDGTPHPAADYFLETNNDNAYFLNSSRVPWHLGTSYLINGDIKAKNACDKMNSWLKKHSSNNIEKIEAGYELNGNSIEGSKYTSLVYLAPLAVSACVNKDNQVWLNDLWTYVVNEPVEENDYFNNTIKMLCMLNVSQNYFPPEISLKDYAAKPKRKNIFRSIAKSLKKLFGSKK